MLLRSIRYREHANTPLEWELENFELGKINLIVGKNATGKTRTLNVLNGLAKLVSGDIKLEFADGEYEVSFEEKKNQYKYELVFHENKVESEIFKINDEIMLKRGKGGKGEILTKQLGPKKMMQFQAPENELAVVARRDSIQHPFFEPLNKWGKSILHFAFGSSLGKEMFAIITDGDKKITDEVVRDTSKVIAIFRRGKDLFGTDFVKGVIKDMKTVGYDLEKIELKYPHFIQKIEGNIPPGEFVALYVKENSLKGGISQREMSQGMFRALSIVIQLNYAERTKATECILIDDIGEGLDFDRSCSLIKLMMDKVMQSSVQLVMTTNDRFVMNTVPLEYWSVLNREGSTCHIYNYKNSQKVFDEFKFTGLNNFDFLATNFVIEMKQK